MSIKYYIEDLYQDEEKKEFKNKIVLKSKPPKLIVSNEKGEYVIFELNKEQTEDLIKKLKLVNRAHHGLSPKETAPIKSFADLIERYFNLMSENPIKGILVSGFIFLVIFSIVKSVF